MKSEVFNEDCLEAMKAYPDNYFELAIVDPPYFEDYGKANYTGASVTKKGIKRISTDIKNWDIPNESYFEELFRVSKNQIIWGCNYYAKHIPSFGRIVWDKKNDSSTFSKCELASHSFGVRVDIFRFMWNGMLQENMKNKEDRIHPTQKPVALYRWLLQNYAKQGDKILDTHLGSGSSRIAADMEGYDFTGYELDTDYFNASVKRFNEYKLQSKLL
jgi:site-specific DNA-methyltransferase (adenine-specific)